MKFEIDFVPVRKFPCDRLIRLRVVVHQVVEGLVGKNHTKSECVVGVVAFVNRDFIRRKLLLHQKGEIEAARSATHDFDLHSAISSIRTARGTGLGAIRVSG